MSKIELRLRNISIRIIDHRIIDNRLIDHRIIDHRIIDHRIIGHIIIDHRVIDNRRESVVVSIIDLVELVNVNFVSKLHVIMLLQSFELI